MSDNNTLVSSLPGPPHLPVQCSGMPVGSVVAFAGEIRPKGDNAPHKTNLELFGWLLCDGRKVKTAEYPELFQVIGHRYGGQGDEFNMPDYQGMFLRCVDNDNKHSGSNEERDPPPNGDNNSVGSTQEAALQKHRHYYLKPTPGTPVPSQYSEGIISKKINRQTSDPLEATCNVSQYETRPVNCYVYYIIKARHG